MQDAAAAAVGNSTRDAWKLDNESLENLKMVRDLLMANTDLAYSNPKCIDFCTPGARNSGARNSIGKWPGNLSAVSAIHMTHELLRTLTWKPSI